MRKILLLGGSAQQIIAIQTAKRLGYYTVLCDYLSDNPGKSQADKFYLVSTTDKNAVLEVAQKDGVNGVLAYASDPAAPTAAYIARQLGLAGNPYESVDILCNKDKFRSFLAENGFCTPAAKGYSNIEDAARDLLAGNFRFPVIVKPVDSSGSKGVSRIDKCNEIQKNLKNAMFYSRAKRIIVEEFVEKYGYQIAGDGLSINGKLVFYYFANDHFNPKCINPFVPVSASFPYNMPYEIHEKICMEIQRLLTALHMNSGTYNFDMRIDKDGNIYLMEVAPRDGGNYIPDVIRYATGVDLVECSVKIAMGEPIEIFKENSDRGYWSYFAIHSLEDGILDEIQINHEVADKHIIESHIICKSGQQVYAFTGANTTLGCLIMKFDSMEEMLDMMDNSEQWCHVKLKEKSI